MDQGLFGAALAAETNQDAPLYPNRRSHHAWPVKRFIAPDQPQGERGSIAPAAGDSLDLQILPDSLPARFPSARYVSCDLDR